MRWQSKKDSLKFLQIGPTMRKKNLQLAKSNWSITQRQSPNGRVHCRVLKRTRWWAEGVFGYGTSKNHIFWEDGKRGAELQMLRLVLLPWGLICICPNSDWALTDRDYARVASAFVGSFIYDLAERATAGYLKQGVTFFSGQKRPRVRQGLNEMTSENFARDTFSLEDTV